MLSEGAIAIFGPSDSKANGKFIKRATRTLTNSNFSFTLFKGIVSSICDTFSIPHFIANWRISEDSLFETHKFTRNFFPESNFFSRALAEIAIDFEWKSFTVLYDSNDGTGEKYLDKQYCKLLNICIIGLMRLQDILQINGPDDSPITVRKMDDSSDFRPLLKEIQKMGETHIIIDCHISKILELFRQANEVKMMEEYQVC